MMSLSSLRNASPSSVNSSRRFCRSRSLSSRTRSRRASNKRSEMPFPSRSLFHRRVLAKELEVLAVVEDVEALLVLTRAEEILAESRAAPDDLPELSLASDQLE